jgi:hypothetical protein
MVCCATIHTCRRWLWTISCIVSRFLTVVTNYWSSTSSKSSSSMTSSSEASYVSLIISCGVLYYGALIVLWLHIIVLWWHCKLCALLYCGGAPNCCVLLYCGCAANFCMLLYCGCCTGSLSLIHPAPYKYLMSSPSLFPKFYSPCLHVQLTCKNYKM